MKTQELKYPVVEQHLRARRNPNLCAKVKRRDKHTCQVCGFKGSEAHHIHSIQLGGLDDMNNMICLCRECHKSAPNQPDEFLSYQKMGGRRRMAIYGVAALEVRKNPTISFQQAMDVADAVHKYLCEVSIEDNNY